MPCNHPTNSPLLPLLRLQNRLLYRHYRQETPQRLPSYETIDCVGESSFLQNDFPNNSRIIIEETLESFFQLRLHSKIQDLVHPDLWLPQTLLFRHPLLFRHKQGPRCASPAPPLILHYHAAPTALRPIPSRNDSIIPTNHSLQPPWQRRNLPRRLRERWRSLNFKSFGFILWIKYEG